MELTLRASGRECSADVFTRPFSFMVQLQGDLLVATRISRTSRAKVGSVDSSYPNPVMSSFRLTNRRWSFESSPVWLKMRTSEEYFRTRLVISTLRSQSGSMVQTGARQRTVERKGVFVPRRSFTASRTDGRPTAWHRSSRFRSTRHSVTWTRSLPSSLVSSLGVTTLSVACSLVKGSRHPLDANDVSGSSLMTISRTYSRKVGRIFRRASRQTSALQRWYECDPLLRQQAPLSVFPCTTAFWLSVLSNSQTKCHDTCPK